MNKIEIPLYRAGVDMDLLGKRLNEYVNAVADKHGIDRRRLFRHVAYALFSLGENVQFTEELFGRVVNGKVKGILARRKVVDRLP